MLGYTHPHPAQCMLGYSQQVGGAHPTGMHSCWMLSHDDDNMTTCLYGIVRSSRQYWYMWWICLHFFRLTKTKKNFGILFLLLLFCFEDKLSFCGKTFIIAKNMKKKKKTWLTLNFFFSGALLLPSVCCFITRIRVENVKRNLIYRRPKGNDYVIVLNSI